jgi:hypothetical protein
MNLWYNIIKLKGRYFFMGAQMRERPIVTGRDAKRFVDKSKENRINLSERAVERSKKFSDYGRKENARSN